MFFGKVPEPQPVKPEFHSKLILYGLTRGANPKENCAVVGLEGSGNKQTWLVKAGSKVEGEQVLRIADQYILVRNETGKGKVRLRE
jgi:hypothetical protein